MVWKLFLLRSPTCYATNFLDNKVEDEVKSAFQAMPSTIGGGSNFCIYVNSTGDIIIVPGEVELSVNNHAEPPLIHAQPIESKPVEAQPVPAKPIGVPSIPMQPIMLR